MAWPIGAMPTTRFSPGARRSAWPIQLIRILLMDNQYIRNIVKLQDYLFFEFSIEKVSTVSD